MRYPIFIALMLMFRFGNGQQVYFPDPEPGIAERLEAWQDLKFGLLMHWGPYAQWGIVESWSICPEDLSWADGARRGEDTLDYYAYLKRYENLKTTFNPVHFNPERWAKAAREAGMKYMLFTTKHHDGFCMFNTAFTDYNIADRGCAYSAQEPQDIAKELFEAFREQGFWTGAYFSKPDWHSPYYWWRRFPPADRHCNYSIQKYPDRWNQFINYTHGQINELMSHYGKMDILWLDGGWVRPISDSQRNAYLVEEYEGSRYARNPQSQDIQMPQLVRMARNKQPGLLVVDRAVPGIHQNYLTPEQHIPDEGLPYPWETCMTMATSWSHVPDDKYKSSEVLIQKLVDIVSKGGNLLLNIGPSADGRWDDTAYARLEDIAAWMKINSASIYGTRAYKQFSEGDSIRFTRSKDGKTRFVFLFRYPNKALTLHHMEFQPETRIRLLGSAASIAWKRSDDGGLTIDLPAELQPASRYVWVLELKEEVGSGINR